MKPSNSIASAAAAMRGSPAKSASRGGGDGHMISQVAGERFTGSSDRRLWSKVVPERGKPLTKMGATICSAAISG